ncbi:MAG TPA: hypothetical protein VI011_11865 [Asanoa sp.]
MPADELVEQDIAGTDIWCDLAQLTDLLGNAATPWVALDQLQSFVARSAGEPDPLVNEAVWNLMPWHGSGTAALPALLSISERQSRRRCRAAVGVGPKELHRVLRFQGFIAPRPGMGCPAGRLRRRSRTVGRRDRVPRSGTLSRECRRLTGVTPGEFLAQSGGACGCGHDHAASYVPMLRPGDGRFVQERRPIPA